jgi:hypothetical protein
MASTLMEEAMMSSPYWLKSIASYIARWALVILFISASSMSTQAQMTRTMAQEIYSRIAKPADAISLLQNVKFAVDRDLLLREDFYVDSVLERFFGGSRIIWQHYPTWKKWGEISEFGFLTEESRSNTRTWDGLGIRFGWSATDPGRAKSLLSINFTSVRSPTANDVQRVFGTQWRDEEIETSPHRAFKAPTHPLGNRSISYIYESATIKRTARFNFAFDGSTEIADFALEGVAP